MQTSFTILELIDGVRESDEYIELIYLQGSCYNFFKFIKKIFPSVKPYVNKDKNHVAIKFNNDFYDIRGLIDGSEFTLMTENEISDAENWSFFNTHMLTFSECENCGEPFTLKI